MATVIAPADDAWTNRLRRGASRLREVSRGAWIGGGFVLLALILLLWLCIAAPPWRMRTMAADQGVELLASDGSVFAHRGTQAGAPIAIATLPADVRNAFVAIEDQRFYRHGALDAVGLARASWRNLRARSVIEGGSTITQQYVKNAYLENDRTFARKAQEIALSAWIELWMSKDEILSRYLARVYFGDQCFGLEAAARHYFAKTPAQLSLGEAALLAGLVKAPSRLAPTHDIVAAGARMRLVLDAMAHAGFITPARAAATPVPALIADSGSDAADAAPWFADWVMATLPPGTHGKVATTLDLDLQRRAEAAVAHAPLGGAEAALIAMRPDGSVVAMVGGRDHDRSQFNRATQARRQPGSAFKLFDYLTAFRNGAKPDDPVDDAPLRIGTWQPTNAYAGYRGRISLREAFAISSNVAAVRVTEAYGRKRVIQTARDLGVVSPLPDGPSMALGAGTMPLIELASAYAAVAGGRYPVTPHGIAGTAPVGDHRLDQVRERAPMLELLWQSANVGTGRLAALVQPTFGKTGTSQDGRDALFVGFAGDLVAAVWTGRDDNGAMPGASGGHLPAEIWRDFMDGIPLKPIPGIHINELNGPVPVRAVPDGPVAQDGAMSSASLAAMAPPLLMARGPAPIPASVARVDEAPPPDGYDDHEARERHVRHRHHHRHGHFLFF